MFCSSSCMSCMFFFPLYPVTSFTPMIRGDILPVVVSFFSVYFSCSCCSLRVVPHLFFCSCLSSTPNVLDRVLDFCFRSMDHSVQPCSRSVLYCYRCPEFFDLVVCSRPSMTIEPELLRWYDVVDCSETTQTNWHVYSISRFASSR